MRLISLSFCIPFLFILLVSGCQPGSSEEASGQSATPGWELPYNFQRPNAAYSLPDELLEISGLGTIDAMEIACIQDEAGTVFLFNHPEGYVKNNVAFGKDHDYEGVSYVDSTVYVLRSNGKLYEIQNFAKENQTTIKHKTFLKKANNTEGLAYDEAHNRLLISCRGIPGDEKSLKEINTIYAFDLETKTLDSIPVYSFSIDDIYEFMGIGNLQKGAERAANFLVPGSLGRIIFHPSGLAVHPKTEDIYIVAAKANAMMVLDRDGSIKHLSKLNKRHLPKAEGICFLPNGDMLIANEGKPEIKDDFSVIWRYHYQGERESGDQAQTR